MFPATLLLEHLAQTDIELLLSRLKQRQFLADELIIAEGDAPRVLYLVLNGLVTVYTETPSGQRRELAHLGAGEILGDVSWLERSAASAFVRAKESSLLGALDVAELEDVLASNNGFAMRFFRGVAALNASRVRRLTSQLRAKEGSASLTQQQDGIALRARLDEFKDLLLQADRQAIETKGNVRAETAKHVRTRFASLVEELNVFMNMPSDEISDALKQEFGASVQKEMLPYVVLSALADRSFSKPRGYAGDFETIEMM